MDLPDLNNRLQTWLRQFDITPAWVMCGGGEYADSIRARQPWAGWCDTEAHDLAVLAMDANTYETSELLGLKVVELTYPQSERHLADYTAIAVSQFLNDAEPRVKGSLCHKTGPLQAIPLQPALQQSLTFQMWCCLNLQHHQAKILKPYKIAVTSIPHSCRCSVKTRTCNL